MTFQKAIGDGQVEDWKTTRMCGFSTRMQRLLATSRLGSANILLQIDSHLNYTSELLHGIPMNSSRILEADIVHQIQSDSALRNKIPALCED